MIKNIIIGLFLFIIISPLTAQEKHLIGIKVSPFSYHVVLLNDLYHSGNYVNYDLEYSYQFSNKHSFSISVGFNKKHDQFEYNYHDTATSLIYPVMYISDYYNFTIPLHYLFHYKKWFVEAGLDSYIFNGAGRIYRDEELIRKTFLEKEVYSYTVEYHLGIGRDIDINRFKIRLNAFVNRKIGGYSSTYFRYGISGGLYFKF